MTIARYQLKMAMVGLRWTQEQLADKAGVTLETVSRLSTGASGGRRSTWIKLRDALIEGGAEFSAEGNRIAVWVTDPDME